MTTVWRVVSLSEYDTETQDSLYWSNTDGWVDKDSAETFTDSEKPTMLLPIGGAWEADALKPLRED